MPSRPLQPRPRRRNLRIVGAQPFHQVQFTLDGVTNLANQWASDELYFPTHDFGGPIFESRKNYEKWNPMNNIKHWATPQMIMAATEAMKQ